MSIPDTLAHRLELFRETGLVLPDAQDVFRVDSWVQVLVGQRIKANAYHHLARMSGDEKLRTMLATLKGTIGNAVGQMPTHKQFLDSYCLIPDDRIKAAGAK
jgi:tryptophan halogenase